MVFLGVKSIFFYICTDKNSLIKTKCNEKPSFHSIIDVGICLFYACQCGPHYG